MAQPVDYFYPVPRVAEGLGDTAITLYIRMCGKSSFRSDDDYKGHLIIENPILRSQLVVTISWMQRMCLGASRGKAMAARDKLIKHGLLIKLCEEGDMGNRYFLPHQDRIRAYKEAQNGLQDYDTPPASEQYDNNTQTTGQQQGNNTPAKSGSLEPLRLGDALREKKKQRNNRVAAPKQQGNDSFATGQLQDNNNNTKYIIPNTHNSPQSDDDDDHLDTIYSNFKDQEKKHRDFIERVEAWYLAIPFTSNNWTLKNSKLLEEWVDKWESMDLSLSDIANAFLTVEGNIMRSDPHKIIYTLAYFEDEVFRSMTGRMEELFCKTGSYHPDN